MKPPEGTFWIGSEHPFDLHEVYLNFRADLLIDGAPAATWLSLTADSRYRLWINGAFVGRGPERSWPATMAVDRIDVTRHLRQGTNAIAVQVYGPGYSHFAHVDRAATGMIAWVVAGEKVILRSDRNWRVGRDPSWDPMVPRVSIYGAGVERRNLARATDWQTAAVPDWAQARIVQGATGPVWAALRPRATPLQTEDLHILVAPWRTWFGPTPAPGGDSHRDLGAALDALPQGPVPEAMAAGQTAIWVFDLGHARTCVAGAQITAAGGEVLTVSYAEKLHAGRVVISDPTSYCRMRPTDTTTLEPGRQTVEGFGLRGGRYVIFRLDAAGPVTPAPVFHVRLPSYPLAERALPDLGSELNAVAAMCRRTLLTCLQDGFVDSIWREQSQWLGDAVAQAFALRAISDDSRPLLFALDMAAEGAAPDGILPSILPGEVPAYVVTDYNFSWVELLAMAADHPGVPDKAALVLRHRASLRQMLARFARGLGDDGLLRSEPGRRLFLDWSPMSRDEPNLTYNLRYLHARQLAAILDPEGGHDATAAAVQGAILRSHRDDAGGWHEAPGGAAASALALALLVLTGTLTGDGAHDAMQAVVARSLDLDDGATPGKLVLPSPFMHHYVFQALDRLGQRDAIRAIIAARWGRWAGAGAPTTWENWSIDFPDGSACHGFSAHPLGWLRR